MLFLQDDTSLFIHSKFHARQNLSTNGRQDSIVSSIIVEIITMFYFVTRKCSHSSIGLSTYGKLVCEILETRVTATFDEVFGQIDFRILLVVVK